MNHNPEFTQRAFLKIVGDAIWEEIGRNFKDWEFAVLEGVWNNKTYEEIVQETGYSIDCIASVEREFWQQLSLTLDEEINPKNWRSVLAQKRQQDIQAILTQGQTQLEDRPIASVDDVQDDSINNNIVENTDNSLDVNRLVENIGNEISQRLSICLDENVSKANSQAASTAKLDQGTKFTCEIAKDLISQHIGRKLDDLEKIIIENGWEYKKHTEIAEDNNYDHGYVCNRASELWQQFSIALGEEVSKTNWKFAFERKWQQDTQANLTQGQTQVKDRFVGFLLDTRNACAKSYNFLVKDAVNKIWQKLCRVWNEKVTPENWQAAFQPKLDRDTKLTAKIVAQVIDSINFRHTGKHLIDLEKEVVCGTWYGESYDKIAEKTNRDSDHIRKGIGDKLWQRLSKALGKKINKRNFKSTLEGLYEDMELGFA